MRVGALINILLLLIGLLLSDFLLGYTRSSSRYQRKRTIISPGLHWMVGPTDECDVMACSFKHDLVD